MILKWKINDGDKVIKCRNIVSNKKDPKYGLACERILLHRNSVGKVAGQIKCIRCGSLFDIQNNELILIKSGDKNNVNRSRNSK